MKMFMVMFLLVSLMITAVYGTSDYWPGNEWRTSTLEQQGMDSGLIYNMLQTINEKLINIHSVLIIRHGYLVTEAYFDPFQKDTKQSIYSSTKSVVSALYGIALKEDYIQDVKQLAYHFLKDQWPQNTNEEKKSITIEHLLTMTSGIDSLPSAQVAVQAQPLNYVLGMPIINRPGDGFNYNGGTAHLLAGILKKATGVNPLDYAQAKLFTPLGINKVDWDADSQGVNLGGTGISLTPIEMAKFGYLYLQNGIWNGKQIVPQEWIDASTQRRVDTSTMITTDEVDGYGYLWWMNSFGGYAAHGFGGQYIYIVPKSDLVVVFTSCLSDDDFSIPKKLMKTFIMPAVKSNQALPANVKMQSLLVRLLQDIQTPQVQPVTSLPEIAGKISGKMYHCEKNPLSWNTFSLNFNSNNVCSLKMTLSFSPQKTFEIPIGMDNRYRYIRQDMIGESYAKGHWLDAKTFEVTLINASYKMKIIAVFENDQVTIQVNSGPEFKAVLSSTVLAEHDNV
jgi:CubicO group peptidase (beta-lactamase class C family)